VAAVDEPIVDLVADDQQVMALRDLGHAAERHLGEDGASGITRVPQEEHLRAWRDRGLQRRGVELERI
jgi:hypothetical protein